MTLKDIRELVMFQTNNDAEDVGDYSPYLDEYINDGYDRLMYAYEKEHVATRMSNDVDIPALPVWTHKAIADWATWLVYRNGNPQKQSRGFQFRAAFDETMDRITAMGGKAGETAKPSTFYNLP
jgi:hypothetical protein